MLNFGINKRMSGEKAGRRANEISRRLRSNNVKSNPEASFYKRERERDHDDRR